MGRVQCNYLDHFPMGPEDIEDKHWLPVHRSLCRGLQCTVPTPTLPFIPFTRRRKLCWPPVSYPPTGRLLRCFQPHGVWKRHLDQMYPETRNVLLLEETKSDFAGPEAKPSECSVSNIILSIEGDKTHAREFQCVYNQATADLAIRHALDQFGVDLQYDTAPVARSDYPSGLCVAAMYLFNVAGLVCVMAKQTGLLKHLPLGTCALLKTLIMATSPDSICGIILEVQHCTSWLRGMSKEERDEILVVSRLQREEVIPSILVAPHSVMGSLQSLLLRSIVCLSSMAWCRSPDSERGWQEAQAFKASRDKYAFGVSANWSGAERQLCNGFRQALYVPLLEQLKGLASVLNLRNMVGLLSELIESAM
ncbi:hypothetical protein KIPB_000160 [Kipferlia bialata]|uniref:Uncharacterized protein n=1 Tax=Kipferlia bialata TaxID=797122 RepID=A0A9K3CM47_9EUKA|nr:hypothetical protein KIPB_000160 [Kipferlia bialata]|eukprot:g160.t1